MSEPLTSDDILGIATRHLLNKYHSVDFQVARVEFSENTKRWTVEVLRKNRKLWLDLNSDGEVVRVSRFLGEPSLSMWDVIFLCLVVFSSLLTFYGLQSLAMVFITICFFFALVAPAYLKDTLDMSGNFARMPVPLIRIIRLVVTVGVSLVWLSSVRNLL